MQVYRNNASSLLAASITDLDTIIQIDPADATLFGSLAADEYMMITLEDILGNLEVVKCTSITGANLTVERAQEGTLAQSFLMSTTRVENRNTRGTLERLVQREGDIIDGGTY